MVSENKSMFSCLFRQCLRQENRLLKQRVELLEKESSALAERLVRGQVRTYQEPSSLLYLDSIILDIGRYEDIDKFL